jgi:hypothetical protein
VLPHNQCPPEPTGPGCHFLHQYGLCLRVGNGNAGRAAILIGTSGTDDSINTVTLRLGLIQPAQDDDASPFTAGIAIGVFVKGFTAPVSRQKMALAHRNECLGANHGIHAANHGHFHFTTLQRRIPPHATPPAKNTPCHGSCWGTPSNT